LDVLLPSRFSDYVLGFGLAYHDKMYFFLSKNGATKINLFIDWFIKFLSKKKLHFYIFNPEYDIFKNNRNFIQYEDQNSDLISFFDNYPTPESIWGHISSKHHNLSNFYRPYWAYQFSIQPKFGEQLVQYLETMLLNKLALIIDLTVSFVIHSSLTTNIALKGHSAIKLKEGTIIDLETTGVDPNTSDLVSLGILNESNSIVLFNYAKYNKHSFGLMVKDILQQLSFPPFYSYNINFEKKFLPNIEFLEINSFIDGYRARRKEIYLPHDSDPGKGKNVPIWYSLFLSGGDEKKRRLYRRLILLHNHACLINQLAFICTHYEKITKLMKWGEFHFPIEVTKKYKQDTTTECEYFFKPEKYFNSYSYKRGQYARYYDEGYLFQLGLRPIPEHLRLILSSHQLEIRMYRHRPTQEPHKVQINDIDIDERLENLLLLKGYSTLYEYQYHSYLQIINEASVIITAPTGNGKTEAFLLPMLHRILELKENIIGSDKISKRFIIAIIFYPTKALSNDQLQKLLWWTNRLGLVVSQLDGDMDLKTKKGIMNNPPDILLTTPDWVHYNLYRKEIQQIFEKLEIIVFDEIHTYTGSFGTHLYMLLKRLIRLFGPIQVIGASATISNPREFFTKLLGKECVTISCRDNIAKKNALDIVLFSRKQKESDHYDISRLVKTLTNTTYKHTILVFQNSQIRSELIYQQLVNYLGNKVSIHRGGLSKSHRDLVESKLRDGTIQVVVCTSSLEVGIDIGDISCVITPLVPINNLYQRIGRAGRGERPALALIELPADIVGEYYSRNPSEYFSDVSPVVLETNNRKIVLQHILLANAEKPLDKQEFEEYQDIMEVLERKNIIEEKYEHMNSFKISPNLFSLRSTGALMEIKCKNKVIGTRTMPQALWEYYPEAIRFIAGKKYLVKNIKKVKVPYGMKYLADVVPYYGQFFSNVRVIKNESFKITTVLEDRAITHGIAIVFGRGFITYNILGIRKKIGYRETRNVYYKDYNYILGTLILEISFNDELEEDVLHTLRHLLRFAIKMVLGLENEYQFIKKNNKNHIIEKENQLLLYDSVEGGNGSTYSIGKRLKRLLKRMVSILSSCKCKEIQGCPSCTFDMKCRDKEILLNKNQTLEFLKTIL
ncbi:MAG: DEAD/DEAH box helicase, partial [Candidatus Thorarchaeota archaeon]